MKRSKKKAPGKGKIRKKLGKNRDQKPKIKKGKKKAPPVKQPKCLVVNRGTIGKESEDLMRDFRKVFEPNTATFFKNNKLKDLMSVVKPLNCTHLITFSETSLGMYMKICRIPEGPTLTFKISNFSYAHDVQSLLKKMACYAKHFFFGPCLMTNLQLDEDKLQLRLTARMFLDMFPTISPQTGNTDAIQRCCLFHYDPNTDLFNFRHYAIRVVPLGLSKATKKLTTTRRVPDLSNYTEVSDFMTKAGILSESEAEDDEANEVTVNDSKPSVRKKVGNQSAVRLYELGPRLTVELRKVEAGAFGGVVLYNKLVKKTEKEKAELERRRVAKRSLYIQRVKEQEKNIQMKVKEREEHKQRCLEGMKQNRQYKRAYEGYNPQEPDDDREYFKKEVGEEPEPALFDRQNKLKKNKPAYVAPWKKKKEEKEGEEGNKNDTKGKFRKGGHMKGNFKGNKIDKKGKKKKKMAGKSFPEERKKKHIPTGRF